MDAQLQLELVILVFVLTLARVLYLIHKITTGHSAKSEKKRNSPCKTLICIGSGGHTTEMLQLVATLDPQKYSPRTYIVARSDTTSQAKITKLEDANKTSNSNFRIFTIPRSRNVHQSYISSVFTTMYSILYCIPLVVRIRPELILCNGPGTCIPICLISFVLKAAFLTDTRIVFVESFCRTETFSLSGKILMYFADNFLVQWPNLKRKLKRAEFIGQLM